MQKSCLIWPPLQNKETMSSSKGFASSISVIKGHLHQSSLSPNPEPLHHCYPTFHIWHHYCPKFYKYLTMAGHQRRHTPKAFLIALTPFFYSSHVLSWSITRTKILPFFLSQTYHYIITIAAYHNHQHSSLPHLSPSHHHHP